MATTPKKPTDHKKPLTAAQRRAREASSGQWYAGELNGQILRLSHPQTWRSSAMEALNRGDMVTWASKVLHPDDMEAFRAADPNSLELAELITAGTEYFGADSGE